MEAKDTVMNEGQLIEVIYMAIETPDKDNDEGWKNKQRFRAVAKVQASISFKAGQDSRLREVEEWMDKNCLGCRRGYKKAQQAMLKAGFVKCLPKKE